MTPERMPSGTLSSVDRAGLERRRRQIGALAGQAGERVRRHGHQRLRAVAGHQEADHAGQTRRAVAVLGEAHRDADGEQQAEIVEDRVAGRGHERRCSAGPAGRAAAAAPPPAAPRSAASARGRAAAARRRRRLTPRAHDTAPNFAAPALVGASCSARTSAAEVCSQRRARPGRGTAPASASRIARLQLGHHGRRGRQLGDAEADQDRRGRRARTARPPQTATGRLCCAAPAAASRDQPQHRRMQGVDLRPPAAGWCGPWPARIASGRWCRSRGSRPPPRSGRR